MGRKAQSDFALIILGLVAAAVIAVISAVASALSALGTFIVTYHVPVIITVVLIVSIPIFYLVYEHLYFKSEKFQALKNGISEYINNCNELNHHISELKSSYANIKSFDYGSGSLKDESKFNFKREHWSNETKNQFIHNCSAAICKNALNQPLKYLCKYFDIEITESSLANIEGVLNNFAAAEQGKYLLQSERDSILDNAKSDIPWAINSFSSKRLVKELGFEDVDLSDLYFPVYTFQYVSPGGNSTLKCDVKLDIENLDKLVTYMRGLINFAKSIEGQRALMTSSLREKIKARDNFTCQKCGISSHTEKHLLLEIDHIMPLSRGGITSESNLQTLCWKCNRTKGSKVLQVQN